jgi:hypothetical protein
LWSGGASRAVKIWFSTEEVVGMDNHRSRLGLGILLLFAGVVLLLQNLGVFGPFVENLIWLLLFGLAGRGVVVVYCVL